MVTDYEHGGYNLDDNEIGTFIMIIGVMQLLYQVCYYVLISYIRCFSSLCTHDWLSY